MDGQGPHQRVERREDNPRGLADSRGHVESASAASSRAAAAAGGCWAGTADKRQGRAVGRSVERRNPGVSQVQRRGVLRTVPPRVQARLFRRAQQDGALVWHVKPLRPQVHQEPGSLFLAFLCYRERGGGSWVRRVRRLAPSVRNTPRCNLRHKERERGRSRRWQARPQGRVKRTRCRVALRGRRGSHQWGRVPQGRGRAVEPD